MYVMGAQKNRLIETVLLSIHNICFGCEIRKLLFRYTLFLIKGLIILCLAIVVYFSGIWYAVMPIIPPWRQLSISAE